MNQPHEVAVSAGRGSGSPHISAALLLGLSSLAYFLAQVLAFKFPDSFGLIAAVWPAAGIGLASLLLSPRRLWPALLACLFAAGVCANLTTERPVMASVGFMIANITETAASAWLITRFCGDRIGFTRVREVIALAGTAIFVNALTALIGAKAAHFAIRAQFWNFYWTWWIADGLGLLLATPLIVVWVRSGPVSAGLRWSRSVEGAGLIGFSGIVAFVEFGSKTEFSTIELAPFWLPVLLIWAALRCGPLVTATLLGVFAVITIGCTAAGLGTFPLGGAEATLRLLSVQSYLGVMGVTGLVVATAVAQQRESQALLRAVVEGTSDAIYVKDRQGRYLLFNSAAARFAGKAASEVIGRDDTCLFPPAEAKGLQEIDQIAMAAGQPWTYEEHLTGGAGEVIEFITTKGPLHDESGALIGLFGIARDVTERKHTETALRESEEWHRAILQTAMNGFWLADTEGRLLEVNDAYCRMSGYSARELLTMRIADVEACESPMEALAHIRKIMTTGEDRFETKQRRKDGSIFDVEINVQYRPVDGGRLVIFLHDITTRKRAAETLRASEERYRSVIETSLDGVLFATADGQILAANAAACRMFECTEEEFRQLGRSGTVDTRDPRLALALAERSRTGTFRGELTFRRKGGEFFPGEISTAIFATEDGSQRSSIIIRDTTARKQAEAALQASEATFKAVTELSPIAIYASSGGDQKAVFINDAFHRIFGFSMDDVPTVGQWWIKAFPDEKYRQQVSDRWTCNIEQANKNKTDVEALECVCACKNGSEKIVTWVGKTIGDEFWAFGYDLTDRKQAEEALRASEQRYRTILNASPDDITISDLKGRILMVSPAGRKMFGYENEDDFLQRAVTDALVAEDRPVASSRIALMFQGIMPGVNQYRGLRRNGTVFDLEVNTDFIRDAAGTPTHLIFVARDITARKQAEAKIAASARKLLAVLNASPLPHALNDDQQNITFLNAAFVRTFGYTLEDIPTLADWWPKAYPDPQYRRKVADAWSAAMAESQRTGTDFLPLELNVRCKDGTDKTALVSAAPLAESFEDEHLVVMQDITERKAAEVALTRANDRLSLAARAGGVGIWDFDVRNNRLIWDDEMYRLYGITADQFEGAYAAWQKGVHPDDRTRGDAEIQAALRGEKEFDTEFRALWPDGSVHFIRALSLVKRDADGQPLNMVGTNWDITAQKQAEAALQASLREKEALLKEVHHRVKNNLQVITSLLRLESGRSKQPTTKSVLEDMQGRIRSMAMLHEALYRSGTFAAVDLGVYLKQITTQLYRALVATPGAIQLQLDLAAVPIEMDQAMPCGLLVNELVSNAFKHGFPDGRTGEVRVELHRVAGGPQLRLGVSDTGVGLPANLESRRSQSLGLQLVGDLARQVDGSLETGSGPGTSFTITFTPRLHAVGSNPPIKAP